MALTSNYISQLLNGTVQTTKTVTLEGTRTFTFREILEASGITIPTGAFYYVAVGDMTSTLYYSLDDTYRIGWYGTTFIYYFLTSNYVATTYWGDPYDSGDVALTIGNSYTVRQILQMSGANQPSGKEFVKMIAGIYEGTEDYTSLDAVVTISKSVQQFKYKYRTPVPTTVTPYIFHNGEWVQATPQIFTGGAWEDATPTIFNGGWKG